MSKAATHTLLASEPGSVSILKQSVGQTRWQSLQPVQRSMSLKSSPRERGGRSSAVFEEIGSGYCSVISLRKSPALKRYGSAVMHEPQTEAIRAFTS